MDQLRISNHLYKRSRHTFDLLNMPMAKIILKEVAKIVIDVVTSRYWRSW